MISVVLIGFMGAGKTTIGQQLAHAEKSPFFDTDALIEKKMQQTPQAIFDQAGETTFRNIEHTVLKQALTFDNGILATGGGVVDRLENQQLLQQTTVPIVYLKASFGTIAERLLGDDSRPLLKQQSFLNVANLYLERQVKYEECADKVITVDQLAPAEIVQQIQKEVLV